MQSEEFLVAPPVKSVNIFRGAQMSHYRKSIQQKMHIEDEDFGKWKKRIDIMWLPRKRFRKYF